MKGFLALGTLYSVLRIVFCFVMFQEGRFGIGYFICGVAYRKVNVACFAFRVCCQICIVSQLSEILRETVSA